jgi:hypothetical protein
MISLKIFSDINKHSLNHKIIKTQVPILEFILENFVTVMFVEIEVPYVHAKLKRKRRSAVINDALYQGIA